MMLNSLLVGFRSRSAMQAELIALRHQLTVLQRTHRPKRLVLNRVGIDAYGFGYHDCGRVGVLLSSLPRLKPSSAGIAKDSAGIGLGRFVMAGMDDLVL